MLTVLMLVVLQPPLSPLSEDPPLSPLSNEIAADLADRDCTAESVAARSTWKLQIPPKKLPKPQVVQSCTGGNCPLQVAPSAIQGSTMVQPRYDASMLSWNGAYWSHPGDIGSHLRNTHGVDPSGLTAAQQEALHSNLHQRTQGPVTYRRRVWRR